MSDSFFVYNFHVDVIIAFLVVLRVFPIMYPLRGSKLKRKKKEFVWDYSIGDAKGKRSAAC